MGDNVVDTTVDKGGNSDASQDETELESNETLSEEVQEEENENPSAEEIRTRSGRKTVTRKENDFVYY